MGVQRGKPHNEHLKYPMSIGRKFYPEWAPWPMSLVLSEHMSNSAFPQTSEAWLSLDSLLWMPLINLLLPRPPFRVFNLGIIFVVMSPFRVFDLTSHFLFLFIFLWFKLPFRVFTLNPFFLVASSIILLDYISVDGIGELFPIHFGEYQCSFWECLFHNIRSFPVGWPFPTGILSILGDPFEH